MCWVKWIFFIIAILPLTLVLGLGQGHSNAKNGNYPNCVKFINNPCSKVDQTGIYTFAMAGVDKEILCEKGEDGKMWTVFQKRGDYGDSKTYFDRNWREYRNGFGDPSKQFWLGLEYVYCILGSGYYLLQIDFEDWHNNSVTSTIRNFQIKSEEDGYEFSSTTYSSNVDGLDIGYGMEPSINQKFSTSDNDQDPEPENCAELRKGGWWFGSGCDVKSNNLNGWYYKEEDFIPPPPGEQYWEERRDGLYWEPWGWHYNASLKSTAMKFRKYENRD